MDHEDRPQGRDGGSDPGADATLPLQRGVAAGPPASTEAGREEQPGGDPTLRLEPRAPTDPHERATLPAAGAGDPTLRRPGAKPPDKVSEASGRIERTGEVIAGRFEVVRTLGEGGMGRVYQVRDRQIEGRQVALKVLRDRFSRNADFRKLFFREIKTAQKFVDEHVNQVRDTGQMDDGRLFLTMDLVDGESLADLLKREKSVSERHALEIARQTLLALASGHEHGFVHRDVKPDNVMLASRVPKTEDNPFGVGVRLCDFGIAGLAAEVSDEQSAGTPAYMSPEQARGQRLDARSDLFAVGVMLYEMVSGRKPFHGKTLQEVVTSVVETRVEPLVAELEHVGKPVRKLLLRALEKDRDRRFQSAMDFARAIESSKAYRLPVEVPSWAWGGLVVLGLMAGAEGVWLFDSRRQVEELRNGRTDQLAGLQASFGRQLSDKDNVIAAREAAVAEREQRIAEKDAQIAELDRQLATLKSANVGKKAEEDDTVVSLKAELGNLTSRTTTLEEQRNTALEANKKLQDDLHQLEVDKNKLAEQVQSLRSLQDPLVQKADGFARVMQRVEQGLGTSAGEVLDDLHRRRLFDSGRKDEDFLRALADAAAGLERWRRSDGADGRSLTEAAQRLEAARGLRIAFEDSGADWLDARVMESQDGKAARLARVDRALETLHAQIAPAVEQLASRAADDWRALMAGGPLQDPADAFRHEDLHHDGRIGELVSQAASALEQELALDGRLDVAKLEDAVVLDAWGQRLAQGGPLADGDSARTLRLLWIAKRWYGGDDVTDFDPSGVPLEAIDSQRPDWRAVLRLEVELARPGSPYPIRPGRMLVFRAVQPDGTITWWVETLESSSANEWAVKRRMYREDASPLGGSIVIHWERRGRAFALQGSTQVVLDLDQSGAGVSVAPFPKAYQGPLPPQLGVPPHDLQRFRDALAAGPRPCLKTEREGEARWISPDWGLAREEARTSDGLFQRELVFATPLE